MQPGLRLPWHTVQSTQAFHHIVFPPSHSSSLVVLLWDERSQPRVIHCRDVRVVVQPLGKNGGNITGLECRPTFLELHGNRLDRGFESCPPHVIKAFIVGWLRRAHCSRYTVLFVYPLLLPIWCTDG
ncbi:hypothetical protein IRJ41_011179 [Triplophysa rosa]|uniref:Uncharacterized protein n=1 Tax=Triplophysa rosa TaxID=992332 RepID=A0A9W7TSJ0_TRIRA|nr:hypothetical protein IRJ41_011179 [Triplophysa rosa]